MSNFCLSILLLERAIYLKSLKTLDFSTITARFFLQFPFLDEGLTSSHKTFSIKFLRIIDKNYSKGVPL